MSGKIELNKFGVFWLWKSHEKTGYGSVRWVHAWGIHGMKLKRPPGGDRVPKWSKEE